jgi:Uma2 family endonuclease
LAGKEGEEEMSTTTQVTLEQYYEMLPNYEREPEFDDGEIVERPMPTKPHSEMLEFLIFAFRAFRPEFRSYPEWTIAPREGSRRIPDLCLCASPSETPLLCVEIISPDDKASVLRKKIKEYLAWGVEYVWVVDPVELDGDVHTNAGVERVPDGVFRAGVVEVNVRGVKE